MDEEQVDEWSDDDYEPEDVEEVASNVRYLGRQVNAKVHELREEISGLRQRVCTNEELMAEMRKLVAQRDNALAQRRLTDQEFNEIKRQRDHAKALNEELTEALRLAHHECAVLRTQLRETAHSCAMAPERAQEPREAPSGCQ